MPTVSDHADTRMRERCGLSSRASQRIVERAWEKGLKHGDLVGSLKRWADSLYFYAKKPDFEVRIYGDKTYIFAQQNLVTVLDLPNQYKATVKKLIDKHAEAK